MNDQAVKNNVLSVDSKYYSANKSGKGQVLDSLVMVTERDRKHLTRLLGKTEQELCQAKRSGRSQIYSTEELKPYVRHLWLYMERISAGRMKAGLPD